MEPRRHKTDLLRSNRERNTMRFAPALAACATLALLAACDNTRDGTRGNPPSTASQRTYDRVTGSPPTPPDGTPGNPSGTAVQRTYDRATGSDTSGAYPGQRNLPGNAVERAYDKATGSDTSGAYPQNR
jgi:hypothetical protein